MRPSGVGLYPRGGCKLVRGLQQSWDMVGFVFGINYSLVTAENKERKDGGAHREPCDSSGKRW